MPIQVSQLLSVTKPLVLSDPSGSTTVTIKQPTPRALGIREDELSNRTPRTIDGYLHTEVRVNKITLRHLELWLTFEDCTVEIEVTHSETGEIEETISFESDMTRAKFMQAVGKINALIPGVLIEWQLAVREVVPQWDSPFW